VTGRHRMPWLDRMPLPFVALAITVGPIGVVWAAAGLFMLGRLAVRGLC
jgi:hypothetical protein